MVKVIVFIGLALFASSSAASDLCIPAADGSVPKSCVAGEAGRDASGLLQSKVKIQEDTGLKAEIGPSQPVQATGCCYLFSYDESGEPCCLDTEQLPELQCDNTSSKEFDRIGFSSDCPVSADEASDWILYGKDGAKRRQPNISSTLAVPASANSITSTTLAPAVAPPDPSAAQLLGGTMTSALRQVDMSMGPFPKCRTGSPEMGDGDGNEFSIGKATSWDDCIQKALVHKDCAEKTTAVVMPKSGVGGCWCETGTTRVVSSSHYKTQLFGPCTVCRTGSPEMGDGDGNEFSIGNATSWDDCIQKALVHKDCAEKTTAVVMPKSGVGGCYCETGTTTVMSSWITSNYKTQLLGRCTVCRTGSPEMGDGNGNEFYIGRATSWDDCIQKALVHKDCAEKTTAVVMPKSGVGGCWCETGTTRVVSSWHYKTQLFGPCTSSTSSSSSHENAKTVVERALGKFALEGVPNCAYDGQKPLESVPCGDIRKVQKRMNDEIKEGKTSPSEYATRVIDKVKADAGLFYSNPKLKFDLEMSANFMDALQAVSEGYLVLNRDDADFEKWLQEDVEDTLPRHRRRTARNDINNIKKKIKVDLKAKKYKKMLSAGLDVVSAVAGPAGVALGVLSAYLDYHETADAATQQQLLVKSIMEEVDKKVFAAKKQAMSAAMELHFNGLRRSIVGWLKGFEHQFKITLKEIDLIREHRHGGAWEQYEKWRDLASQFNIIKYQWLQEPPACQKVSGGTGLCTKETHFTYDDMFVTQLTCSNEPSLQCKPDTDGCSACAWTRFESQQHAGYYKKDMATTAYQKNDCIMWRNQLIFHIAPLIAVHLSILNNMLMSVYGGKHQIWVPHVRTMIFEQAKEYKVYVDRFRRFRCNGPGQCDNTHTRTPAGQKWIALCGPDMEWRTYQFDPKDETFIAEHRKATYHLFKPTQKYYYYGSGSREDDTWGPWVLVTKLKEALQGLIDVLEPVEKSALLHVNASVHAENSMAMEFAAAHGSSANELVH